jgi:hypothetical protein
MEEIGRGGMATVYRAYQPSMDRMVAIKLILTTIANNPLVVQRFQREARLVARLEHPHILPVYDFDAGYNPPYIVMRYLNGGTLTQILEQGALPPLEAAYLLRQVGLALDYAHRQGIIHRDIKPSNILIDREGNAFVSDFGIARIVADQQLTISGAIVGTPNYMAPEQAQGIGQVDYRADIYALGVILFQMLTGSLPFEADTPMGVLMKHLQEPPPHIVTYNPALSPALDEIIQRALAKAPADRYNSALELVQAVTAALGEIDTVPPARLQQIAQATVLMPSPPATSPDRRSRTQTPSEQHKPVTVIYATAAEYAEIVDEIRGSEAVRQALQHLWAEAARLITIHQGVILERTERSLLALWGAETAREDDAEQAIRAAMAIRAALQQQAGHLLDEADPLPLGIGLHTGLALLAPVVVQSAAQPGETKLTASGATISLANRLARQSEGTVLITQDTYNQVRRIFEVAPAQSLKLRRKQGEIPVYRVLAAKPSIFYFMTRGIEGVETKMVGREAELKLLQNAYLDMVEESETQIITLVGEAGLGKSRLLKEFITWAELRLEYWGIVRGRTSPTMTHQPYALLRDMLSFSFRIRDSDSPAVVRQKLEAGIQEKIGANEQMAHLLGYLAGFDLSDSAHLEEISGDPQQLIGQARHLFKQWVVKLCAVYPVIIELEDLHYADEASLDLLLELVSEHNNLPLLLVGVTRPELFKRRPGWGSGLSYHTRLELHPLDKWASRHLVQEILQKAPEVPKKLRDLLVERAEGNPYYMEELVKMLIDDRVIIRESDEAWRVEIGRIDHLNVPTTLVGLLQARLDSLLYPEKLTLQRAAVIGRVFYDTALLALDAADETHLEDLPGILRRLADRDFIQERATSAFEGSAEYIFDSNLLRDLLLTSLLRRQEQVYAAAAAKWLVQMRRERVDEYSSLLADYYGKAGQLEEAAQYLQRAGEQALRSGAFEQARALFRRGLVLARQIGSIALMLRAVRNAAWLQAQEGQMAEALPRLGLVLSHPTADNEIKEEVHHILAQFGLPLDDPKVAAGQTLELEQVVAEVLAEAGGVIRNA